MTAYRDIPRHIEDQLALYFDNQATPEVCQAIHDWLEEDPANAEVFAEYGTIERMIYNAQKTEDASAIFALLAEAEANAEPDFSLLRNPAFDTAAQTTQPTVTAHELWSLAGYYTAKGLRTKAGVIGSIAAILLLGFVLYMVIAGPGQTPDAPEVADNAPTGTQAQTTPIVATLTAEHSAVWDRRPGKNIYPGQRFTLTQGFAQVTTTKGAVAILEAPASIEFIDNDNAVRLHSGKLVGICETASSKGFLVHTPQMDVIDLGTRFGIAVDYLGKVMLEVFSGEVSVEPTASARFAPASIVRSGEIAVAQDGQVTYRPAPVNRDASEFARVLAYEQQQATARVPDPVSAHPALIARYDFDQAGGKMLRESQGKALFDAEIVGARWVEGRVPGKQALDFTGKGWEERVVLSPEASERLALKGAYTITLWVKIRRNPEFGWASLVTKGNDSWRVLISSNNNTTQIGFYQSKQEEAGFLGWEAVVTDDFEFDRWHHLVVTGRPDGDTVSTRLYLDGVLKADKQLPRMLESKWPVIFGSNAELSDLFHFDGVFDEVAFYDRAVPEDEVRRLYNAGVLPGSE